LTEEADRLVVAHLFVGRLLFDERQRAARLEPAFLDVGE
jgi:hypothetical protein